MQNLGTSLTNAATSSSKFEKPTLLLEIETKSGLIEVEAPKEGARVNEIRANPVKPIKPGALHGLASGALLRAGQYTAGLIQRRNVSVL